MNAPKIPASWFAALKRLTLASHRHPRQRMALVLAALAGTGVTALAVSPLVSASLPSAPAISVVQQELDPSQWATQSLAADAALPELYRSELTRAADTIDSLLTRLGVDDAAAAQFIRNDRLAATVLQGRIGKLVRASVVGGNLQSLVVLGPGDTSADFDTLYTRLTIARVAGSQPARFTVAKAVLPMEHSVQLSSGTIASSLYAAADEAHLPEGVTNQLAEIFATDIDFRHELRQGDRFSVVYEANLADGQPVTWGNASGRVLAARFVNQGRVSDAVWYGPAGGGRGAYFDLQGRSKARAFLASPLAFSRVTSGFSMRFHPILKTWKAHLGVDFGAPTGTPVRCVGEGVVSFAGQQTGYGNVIHIDHGPDRSTVYAHLSRIDVRRGQHVDQGQRIGLVGATGWATGPHLHFEFKVSGKQVDPMTIARASERLTLPDTARGDFKRLAAVSAQRLNQAGSSAQAPAAAEHLALAHFE